MAATVHDLVQSVDWRGRSSYGSTEIAAGECVALDIARLYKANLIAADLTGPI